MIECHNNIVAENDYAIIVGDLTLMREGNEEETSNIINSLNGKKILIRGNHDKFSDQFYLNNGFLAVLSYLLIDKYFFCHYPCYKSQWTNLTETRCMNVLNKTKCTDIIHGHCHNKDPNLWKSDGYSRTNVCVDYTPNMFNPIQLTDPTIVDYITAKY